MADAAQRTEQHRAAAVDTANAELTKWRALRTFVHGSEELSLGIFMERSEKYIMGVCPVLMFVAFWAIVVVGLDLDTKDAAAAATSTTEVSRESSWENVTLNSTGGGATTTTAELTDPRELELAAQANASKDKAVFTSLSAAMTTILGTIVVFCVVRTRVPQVFSAQNTVHKLGGTCSWYWELLSMHEGTLLDLVGFDAFMFLRLPHLATKFCVLAFVPMGLPLMLINADAGFDPSAAGTLKSYTLANIPPGSWKLWLYVMGAWYWTWLLLTLVKAEEAVYIRARHRYFHQARPQDYSVFVQDLPVTARTNRSLRELFEQFYPASEIHSACVLPDARKLEVRTLDLVRLCSVLCWL